MATTVMETVKVEPTIHLKVQTPNRQKQTSKVSAELPQKRQNLRLDPFRALEPARKKLSTIESQRVMAVFEETIRRVEVVILIPYIIKDLDRFRVSLGSELVELLEHHHVIISSYEEIRQDLENQLGRRAAKKSPSLIDEADADEEQEPSKLGIEREYTESVSSGRSSAQSTDTQIESSLRSLSLVAQQISHSVRNILRAFTVNPGIMQDVSSKASKNDPKCKSLIVYLQELRDILMGRLLTTPEEERERQGYLTAITKRERNNAAVIEKLEVELNEKTEDKDQEIFKKNEVIKRLQADLHQIDRFSEENIRRVRGDAEKQEAADEKNSEGKRQKLQTEISQLKSQLQNLIAEHRETEKELRIKKFKVETEVENWILRYDQELGDRQEEYEEIDAIYTDEKKQLHELEERFHTLEKEYMGIMDERRLAREKRERAEREMAMMIKCATTIQAFWRSYKVRKAIAAKNKKKRGGKKGKK